MENRLQTLEKSAWQLEMLKSPLMDLELGDHQKKAVDELDNGKVLRGGVGSGKTYAAIAYYFSAEAPADLIVITTAKKRDSYDWEDSAAKFGISTEPGVGFGGKLTVDSWNNIGKYVDVKNAFFIFDEQRAISMGAWGKAVVKIAKHNRWILLSATPGDTWLDYAPVFVANGFYRNISEFKREHVVYASYVKFPKVERYINVGRLVRLRNQILVEMPYARHTTRHIHKIKVTYDQSDMDKIVKRRWHPIENRPLKDAGEVSSVMRKVVNSDASRLDVVHSLMEKHPKLIIFYNHNPELEMLRTLGGYWTEDEGNGERWVATPGVTIAEWNGHKHQEIPKTDRWVYLVQYQAGAEGWNCIETNQMAFYSLTYSYRNWEQAFGRIDRLNTPFYDLHYHVLMSDAPTDLQAWDALKHKKNFNERDLKL